MLLFDLFIPVLMLICGFIMYKIPPKKINNFYGYSTRRSRKNINTWTFANCYCGMLWIKLGIILLLLTGITAIILIATDNKTNPTVPAVIIALELAALLGSIIRVEIKLKQISD